MTNILIVEKNFDSGFRGKYKGYHIDTRLIKMPQTTSHIFYKIIGFQKYKLINTFLIAIELFDSIVYLNEQIEKIYQRHNQTSFIRNICELNNEKENVVHIIKRILDDIIMILYVYYDIETIEKDAKLYITSIGDLIKSDLEVAKKIKEILKYDKFECFFEVINDLHNAYKHSCLMKEAHIEVGKNCVLLSAYYVKHGNMKSIAYLNHNLMHIVIGFSDFLLEFSGIEECSRKCGIIKTRRNITI